MVDVTQALLDAVDAARWPEIGRSVEGRAVVAGRFGPAGGAVRVVVAGVHGDELSTVSAALELGAALAASPPSRPVWLIPALNPDGVARATKNSARDVDLNRNFPARNFTPEHAPRYCPGPAPLSEPETRAFAALLDAATLAGVVAVHAPFACVNFDGPAEAWAREVADACGWPARADIGYPTPGSLGSWLGRDRGVPVLTLELPPGPYPGFRMAAQAALQSAINSGAIR